MRNEKHIQYKSDYLEYYEKIQSGMTSDVYKLYENRVLKVPKNPKGYRNYFERELFWFKKLNHLDFVPKLIDFETETMSIITEWRGEPLCSSNLPRDWRGQLRNIFDTLKQFNFQHNDLSENELLVQNGKISIIDFAISSIGDDTSCGGVCKNVGKARFFSDDYVLNFISLLMEKDAFKGCEPHLFILWKPDEKLDVEKIIQNNFTIIRKIHYSVGSIRALGPHRLDFLFKLYHGKIFNQQGKAKQGFTVFIVMDRGPKYLLRRNVFNGKKSIVNANMFDCLQAIRNGEFGLIHGSDSIQESYDNSETLDLYDSKIPLNYWEAWRPKFEDMKDFFSALNEAPQFEYVVQRNFDDLLKNLVPDQHDDIDLLVSNFYQFKRLTGAIGYKHKRSTSYKNGASAYEYGGYKISASVSISGREVNVDIRFVGDSYFCKAWEENILRNRSLKNGAYIPCEEDHAYSLLYHALVHKLSFSQKYREKIRFLLNSINSSNEQIGGLTDSLAWELLDKYLDKNGYQYVRPDELSIKFNARSRAKISWKEDRAFLQKLLKTKKFREARHLLYQLLRENPFHIAFRIKLAKISFRFKIEKFLRRNPKLLKFIVKEKLQTKFGVKR